MKSYGIEEIQSSAAWRQLSRGFALERVGFVVSLVFMLLATASQMVLPMIVGGAVDFATNGNRQGVVLFCGYFVLTVVLGAVFEFMQAYFFQKSGQGVIHWLRCLTFDKIQNLPIPFFDSNPTGRLQSRVINDVKSLGELFSSSISGVILDVFMLTGSILTMFWINWRVALLVLSVFPVVLFATAFFGKRLSLAYRRARKRMSAINGFLGENIGAIPTIQRIAAEESRFGRFDGLVKSHTQSQMQSVSWFAMAMPVIYVMYGLTMGLLIAVGGNWVIRGSLTLGLLVAFFGYVRSLYRPLEDLVQKYNVFLSANVAAERIAGIDKLQDERDEETALVREVPKDLSLQFSNVSFAYPVLDKPALKSVSFHLECGQSLAVVGRTGSGKTTLIRLLLKFYPVTSGEVRLAGVSLKDWNRFQLRELVGYIPQDVWLLEGSLRENLLLGQIDTSDETLERLCQEVGLWSYVRGRGGLDLQIVEGGSNLSVGERQLVVFVRTLLRDPPLLVLDEATASLDGHLEEEVMNAIRRVMKNRTTIIIAHRLSTIATCDKVLVLEYGKLVEMGTYQELEESGGKFSEMLKLSRLK